MKIYTSTRAFIVCLSLFIIYSACKKEKENFAKNLAGSYNGTAEEFIYTTSGRITKNYLNCNIRVEEIDPKKVRVTVTPDISNPSINWIRELEAFSQSFLEYGTTYRNPMSSTYRGKITNDSLKYEEYRLSYPGFFFKGKRG
jgi:hypothetical protein